MALKDYVIPTREVQIDEATSFTVRGISFTDLTALVNDHGPTLSLAYIKFTELSKEHGLRPETLGLLVKMLAEEFSEVVVTLIAIASEEPDQGVTIARLPAGVQLDAIEKIAGLTFTGEADVKKLVEIVTRMFEGTAKAATKLSAPAASVNGSGAFASK